MSRAELLERDWVSEGPTHTYAWILLRDPSLRYHPGPLTLFSTYQQSTFAAHRSRRGGIVTRVRCKGEIAFRSGSFKCYLLWEVDAKERRRPGGGPWSKVPDIYAQLDDPPRRPRRSRR